MKVTMQQKAQILGDLIDEDVMACFEDRPPRTPDEMREEFDRRVATMQLNNTPGAGPARIWERCLDGRRYKQIRPGAIEALDFPHEQKQLRQDKEGLWRDEQGRGSRYYEKEDL